MLELYQAEEGSPLEGEDAALAWLDEAYAEARDSAAHRAKARDEAGLP